MNQLTQRQDNEAFLYDSKRKVRRLQHQSPVNDRISGYSSDSRNNSTSGFPSDSRKRLTTLNAFPPTNIRRRTMHAWPMAYGVVSFDSFNGWKQKRGSITRTRQINSHHAGDTVSKKEINEVIFVHYQPRRIISRITLS
jgi:hypothetical protein